jgi:hypothetical protein
MGYEGSDFTHLVQDKNWLLKLDTRVWIGLIWLRIKTDILNKCDTKVQAGLTWLRIEFGI